MYDIIISKLRELNVIKSNGALNSNLKHILKKNTNTTNDIISCTNFLGDGKDITLTQRIVTIISSITTIPICSNDICNNVVRFNNRKYLGHCSNRCLGLDTKTQNKKKRTCLSRLGVENPSQSSIIADKKKATTLKNYGVDNPFKSEDVKQKIKDRCNQEHGVDYYVQSIEFKEMFTATMLHRYGVEHAQQFHSIREKTKDTMLSRYNVKAPLQFDTFLKKAQQTCFVNHGVTVSFNSPIIQENIRRVMLERYGVENPFKIPAVQERIRKVMLERYSVEYAQQSTEIQHNTKQTCLLRYNVENAAQQHISPAILDNINSSDWMYDQHILKSKPLVLIAEELGVSDTMIGNYLHSHGIATSNFFSSIGEQTVNNFINHHAIETITNTRTVITPYELDIYIPSLRLAIEYNGLYWHSESAGKDKDYHKMKHDLCADKGIQLITIFEDEWHQHRAQVEAKLLSILGRDNTKRVFARKTCLIKVSKHDRQDFYDLYHIQGGCNSSIDLGLTHEGVLVACMSFINRGGGEYELTRYATSCHVVGGFSKLFKFFSIHYDFSRVVSFADLRWSTGNLYNVNGWKIDRIIPPDYSYSPDGKTRYHKFNYRRKNLPKLLKSFDNSLTERENCDNNNILRIWDCGKIRFIFDATG